MIEKSCLLDWTVLDLCEKSYRSPHGIFCQAMNSYDILTNARLELIVVCINAKTGDNKSYFSTIEKDYTPLLIHPLSYTVSMRDIVCRCMDSGIPIIAPVTEDNEECVIIATCHEPWKKWFESVFYDYDDETRTSINSRLLPDIRERLNNLRRKTRKNA